MSKRWNGALEKKGNYVYEIPREYKKGMRVNGRIFTDEEMIESIKKDNAPEQVANVAAMPGIIGASLAMPDIHWGYGFPIGGVAAMDMEDGVISPGGVGYDINCGVRLVRTNIPGEEVIKDVRKLIDEMYDNVPAGIGKKAKIDLKRGELNQVLDRGAQWAVEEGFGWDKDIERIEDQGSMDAADPGRVSGKAKQRGEPQLGTLGGGNHFLEIQKVDEIYDEKAAKAFGIEEGVTVVMIHTGSRGCGHQIASDYIREMERAVVKYGIELPDRQLACAPVDSKEGKDYFAAMACGANYAWANRQMILHWVRESFEKVYREDAHDLGMDLVYDVCHNIAKIEKHDVDGKRKKVMVHRKGATRAFPPGRKEVPKMYRDVGQPVIIPGDMGTASYLLRGVDTGMDLSWGSTCHGAGRVMSRTGARKVFRAAQMKKEMSDKGIYVRAASDRVLEEENPGAYKDVSKVVGVTHNAGLSRLVAKMIPLGVMKG